MNWERHHARRHRFRNDNFKSESDYVPSVLKVLKRSQTLEEELAETPPPRPLDEEVKARIHRIAQKLARKRGAIIDL